LEEKQREESGFQMGAKNAALEWVKMGDIGRD
jgi:hypothetical protein